MVSLLRIAIKKGYNGSLLASPKSPHASCPRKPSALPGTGTLPAQGRGLFFCMVEHSAQVCRHLVLCREAEVQQLPSASWRDESCSITDTNPSTCATLHDLAQAFQDALEGQGEEAGWASRADLEMCRSETLLWLCTHTHMQVCVYFHINSFLYPFFTLIPFLQRSNEMNLYDSNSEGLGTADSLFLSTIRESLLVSSPIHRSG